MELLYFVGALVIALVVGTLYYVRKAKKNKKDK